MTIELCKECGLVPASDDCQTCKRIAEARKWVAAMQREANPSPVVPDKRLK